MMLKASDDGGDGGEALPAVHICRFFLTMLGFHPLWVERSFGDFGDRYMTRAREIAAMDRAQRILSGEYGEGSTRLWMSLARGLLSMTRRDRALEAWADERGLVLYETSSEDEE